MSINNHSLNITDTYWLVPKGTGWAILPILIVFGNLLVLIVVIGDRKLRSTALNKFMASRAVSDLLLAILVLPVAVHVKVSHFYIFRIISNLNQIHNDIWSMGTMWCRVHLCTFMFTSTASIVHMVAISFDRYICFACNGQHLFGIVQVFCNRLSNGIRKSCPNYKLQ